MKNDVGFTQFRIINKRFNRKHVKVHVVVIPVARNQLIPALLEGRGDIVMASLSITGERDKILDFTKPVIIETARMEWEASPMPGVWRKPLAREAAEHGHEGLGGFVDGGVEGRSVVEALDDAVDEHRITGHQRLGADDFRAFVLPFEAGRRGPAAPGVTTSRPRRRLALDPDPTPEPGMFDGSFELNDIERLDE